MTPFSPLPGSPILECEHGHPGPAADPSLFHKDACQLQCCLEPPRHGAGQPAAPCLQHQPGMTSPALGPHQVLLAQSTAGGGKPIPDLQHLVIYLLVQALFSWFLLPVSRVSMGQLLILSVSEFTGINRGKGLAFSYPALLWTTQTAAPGYTDALSNSAVLYHCAPAFLHQAPGRNSLSLSWETEALEDCKLLTELTLLCELRSI